MGKLMTKLTANELPRACLVIFIDPAAKKYGPGNGYSTTVCSNVFTDDLFAADKLKVMNRDGSVKHPEVYEVPNLTTPTFGVPVQRVYLPDSGSDTPRPSRHPNPSVNE